jgi:uncharacterized repeat protein (TIGR03803 family)
MKRSRTILCCLLGCLALVLALVPAVAQEDTGEEFVPVPHHYPEESFTFEHLHDFGGPGCEIHGPWAALVEGPDGRLYGTATGTGGPVGTLLTFNSGSVFAINRDGSGCQVLHRFTGSRVGGDGNNPVAGLVFGPGGFLYGTTLEGGIAPDGSNGMGTVFRLRTDGSDYQILHAFASGVSGRFPYGRLLAGADGMLYGTTSGGGMSSSGQVFRLTEAPGAGFTFLVLHEFLGGIGNLGGPHAGLEDGGDGWYYGTCAGGGAVGSGGVYRINASGTYQEVYSPTVIAGAPRNNFSRLRRASDGAFYGYSNNSEPPPTGTSLGAYFRMDAAAGGGWQTTVLFQPASVAGRSDLQRPSSDMQMVEGPDGRLYGTGKEGGDGSAFGGVFVVTRAGDYFRPAVLFRNAAPNPGHTPRGGLLAASDGWLYGTTSGGGAHGGGTLFRLRPNAVLFPVAVDVFSVTQGAERDASTPGAAPVDYQLQTMKDTLVRVQPYTLGPPRTIVSAGLRVFKPRTPAADEVDVLITPASLPPGRIGGFRAGVFSGAPALDFWIPANVFARLGNYTFTLFLRTSDAPLALHRIPVESKYFQSAPDLAVLLFPASRDQARLKPDNTSPWTPAHRAMVLETLLELGRLTPVKRGVMPFTPGNFSAGLRFQIVPGVLEASPLETAAQARRRFRVQMARVVSRENASLAARGIRDAFDLAIGLEATTANRESVITRATDTSAGLVSSEFGFRSRATAPSLLLAAVADAMGTTRSAGPLMQPQGRQMVNLLTHNVVPAPQQVVNAGAFTIPITRAVLHGPAWNTLAGNLRRTHSDLREASSSARRANLPAAVFRLGLILETTGAVSVEFSERTAGVGASLTEPAAGSPWRLVFVSGNGNELSALPFAPEFDAEGFALVVLDAELPADATAVRLVRESTPLWEKTFSSQPPIITTFATSLLPDQRVRMTWAAQDADGEDLTFTVTGRIQGENTAQVLAVGLKEQELIFDASLLPAGSLTVTLEVSDGFNVVSVASPAFELTPAPPFAAIALTDNSTVQLTSSPLVLAGVAYDPTAGVLTGASLRWFEGDTLLGTGEQLIALLGAGSHIIRLEATAPSGLKAESEITLAVLADTDADGLPDEYEAAHPPLQTNVSDADLDLDTDGLTALGEFLAGTDPAKPDTDGDGAFDRDELRLAGNPLDPTSRPGPQTIRVSTTAIDFGVCPGTGQSIRLTTSTPDQPWSVTSLVAGLEITPLEGSGSGNLNLVWRCEGLEPGVHTEVIWLTSPGSRPRQVRVQLTVPGGPVPEPEVTLLPLPDLTLPCDGTGFATATFEAEAILSGASAVQIESDPPSGSRFPLGKHLVTVTAKSFSGSQQASFHVTVLPAAPALAIRQDDDVVVLSWSVLCGDVALESASEFGGVEGWTPVVAAPERFGDEAVLRLPVPTDPNRLFLRLRLK